MYWSDFDEWFAVIVFVAGLTVVEYFVLKLIHSAERPKPPSRYIAMRFVVVFS